MEQRQAETPVEKKACETGCLEIGLQLGSGGVQGTLGVRDLLQLGQTISDAWHVEHLVPVKLGLIRSRGTEIGSDS